MSACSQLRNLSELSFLNLYIFELAHRQSQASNPGAGLEVGQATQSLFFTEQGTNRGPLLAGLGVGGLLALTWLAEEVEIRKVPHLALACSILLRPIDCHT